MAPNTSRDALSRGVANWASLSNDERFEAVRSAARRLHNTGKFRSLGSGVVGIGYGIRERRPKTKGAKPRYGRTPVLVVTVKTKWKQTGGRHEGQGRPVPECLLIQVLLAGRRILLAIPTDVCQAVRPRPHAQRNACRAKSMQAGAPSVAGSIAALVRNADQPDGPVYLIGCQHVIHRALVTFNAVPDLTSQVFSEGEGAAQLGMASRPAPFGPALSSIDASLVRLTEGGLAIASQGGFWRQAAISYVEDEAALAVVSALPWKLYSRFEPMGLRFVRTLFGEVLPYGSNNVPIRIAEVVVARSNGRAPQDGDSGGAVMAGRVLVGIHIAGKGQLSYSIPAFRLFSTSAFTPKLALASELITPS